MPEKLPLQGGAPILGDDTPNITQGGCSGTIPVAAITGLEQELAGLEHGIATLVVHVRDGKLARFTTGRERSHVAGTPQ
jgi:hypothetical protein